MKRLLIPALLFLVFPALAQSQEPLPGHDYLEIPNGHPLDRVEGHVVVEECFNYICPGCNGFEPGFAAWAATLPSYVAVHHVAASFRPDFLPYARAYYAAETLGVADKSHAAVYDAIHKSHTLPAEGDPVDEERIAKFYSAYGIPAQQFLATMRGFDVDTKVRRASEYMQRSKVPSTPTIIVNGRYLVLGATYPDKLRIASYLIKKEHPQ
jgi:thiol:disulfide interchange protein DsbA